MSKTISVYMDDGLRRLSIPNKPAWEGSDKLGTGVTLEAIYIGPRTGRVVAETYSCWDDGDGGVHGTSYRLADRDYRAQLANDYPDVADAIDAAHPEDIEVL